MPTFRLSVPTPHPTVKDRAILNRRAELVARCNKIAADREKAAGFRAEAESARLTDVLAGVGDPARFVAAAVLDDELPLRREIGAWVGDLIAATQRAYRDAPSWEDARERAADRLRSAGWPVPACENGSYGYYGPAINLHPECVAAKALLNEMFDTINALRSFVLENDQAIRELEERITEVRRRLLASPV